MPERVSHGWKSSREDLMGGGAGGGCRAWRDGGKCRFSRLRHPQEPGNIAQSPAEVPCPKRMAVGTCWWARSITPSPSPARSITPGPSQARGEFPPSKLNLFYSLVKNSVRIVPFLQGLPKQFAFKWIKKARDSANEVENLFARSDDEAIAGDIAKRTEGWSFAFLKEL